MHILDVVVLEDSMDVTVMEVCDLMGEELRWAKGLILRADGFETEYYKKD